MVDRPLGGGSESAGDRPDRLLVFVSAGDHSRLDRSLRSCEEFDLVIAFYGDDAREREKLRARATSLHVIKGGKFPNLWALWREGAVRLDDYEAVLVLDDDLRLSKSQVMRLSQLRKEHGLDIIGPTFRRTGRISWDANRSRWWSSLRRTSVVEVGAPLMRTECLSRFLEAFDGSLAGFGVEWWYTDVLGRQGWTRFALADEVATVNPHRRSRQVRREINSLTTLEERHAAFAAARERHQIRVTETTSSPWIRRRLPAAAGALAADVADGVVAVSRRSASRARKSARRAATEALLIARIRRAGAAAASTGKAVDYLELHRAWGNQEWSATEDLLSTAARVSSTAPGTIVECGSGLSTVVLGLASRSTGSQVIVLEHDPGWARLIRRRVRLAGLTNVHLLERPLTDSGSYLWYSVDDESLPDRIALLVVDGPPGHGKGGRRGAMERLTPRLDSGATILLDDVHRDAERRLLDEWLDRLGAGATVRFVGAPGSRQFAEVTVP